MRAFVFIFFFSNLVLVNVEEVGVYASGSGKQIIPPAREGGNDESLGASQRHVGKLELPLELRIYVLKAFSDKDTSVSARGIPPELQSALGRLQYAAYALESKSIINTSFQKTSSFNTSGSHCVYITPLEQDAFGRFRLRVVIERSERLAEGKIVQKKVLETVGAVVPNEFLSVCGLKCNEADLVIVIAIRERDGEQTPRLIRPGNESIWKKFFR